MIATLYLTTFGIAFVAEALQDEPLELETCDFGEISIVGTDPVDPLDFTASAFNDNLALKHIDSPFSYKLLILSSNFENREPSWFSGDFIAPTVSSFLFSAYPSLVLVQPFEGTSAY